MKFRGKPLTEDRVKTLREGQLLYFKGSAGKIFVGSLHWVGENWPIFKLEDKRNWEMMTWHSYRIVSKKEYVLWKLEN
jgi:hypothetical protein